MGFWSVFVVWEIARKWCGAGVAKTWRGVHVRVIGRYLQSLFSYMAGITLFDSSHQSTLQSTKIFAHKTLNMKSLRTPFIHHHLGKFLLPNPYTVHIVAPRSNIAMIRNKLDSGDSIKWNTLKNMSWVNNHWAITFLITLLTMLILWTTNLTKLFMFY